jgi:hypothetical protein
MAFSPGSNKNITLVNTSNAPQTIILPLLSDYPDRFIYVKDVTTLAPESTYSNYITIQTSSNDRFENNLDSIQITSQFTNYTFYANPYTNRWNTLNYYGTEILEIQSIKNEILALNTQFTSLLTTLITIILPQHTSNSVDTTINIIYDSNTFPYYNITVPLDPLPKITNINNATKWSLTTSFNGQLSSSGISIATYITISNAILEDDVTGNLFNITTPYIHSIPTLTSGFPIRTTFTYRDIYNTYKSSKNIMRDGDDYSINMYVCIIEDPGKGTTFLDGNFEVSLVPIELPE